MKGCKAEQVADRNALDAEKPAPAWLSKHAKAEWRRVMAETFIPTLEYRRAVAAFATAMRLEPNDIKIILGEDFNAWPESIKPDHQP